MLPVRILKQNAQQERGETARMSSFVGAIAIGDLVKSTLGPKGMVSTFNLRNLNRFYEGLERLSYMSTSYYNTIIKYVWF